MTKDAQFMVSRFPAYKDKILEEYTRNDEFKSLCEDFYSSAISLNNFKTQVMKDKKSEQEYQKVFIELEVEILNFLLQPKPRNSKP